MAITTPSPSRRTGYRAKSRRAFRHAAPWPEQPTGVQILAAVMHTYGQQRTQSTHAGLETSLLAVMAYLWRRGRAEKWAGHTGSAQYACSVEQLVFGLAPIMGWRNVPSPRDRSGRDRFTRRHRHSVQRWLNWLDSAGLITHTAQQDEENFWWRTIIELRAAPPVDDQVLRDAQRRRSAWPAAERARRARGRRRRPEGRLRDLTAILRRAPLTRAQRRQRAIARRQALRDCESRLRVRQLAAQSLADAASEHLTLPVGASTTCRGLLQAISPPKPLARGLSCAHAPVQQSLTELQTNGNSALREAPRSGDALRWAVYQQVLAVRYSRSDTEWEPQTAELQRRVAELSTWPQGRFCPPWRLIEAWSLATHGPEMTAASGGRLALWQPARDHHGPRLARALKRYDRYATVRPPHLPATSIAAFAQFLAQHTARLNGPEHAMAYDVQRFNELTKGMSAYAHLAQEGASARAAAKVRRRDAARALAERVNATLRFRLSPGASLQRAVDLLESNHPAHQAVGRRLWAAEQSARERQMRDDRVRAGQDPWPYDNRYRAADRYAARWHLPRPQWGAAGP